MINGIINVYKEPGFTSHDVVAKLRGIVKQKKIGHTGTLDPDAAGVLPACLGRATKVAGLLTDERKTYECVMLLGVTTDTQDTSGRVLRERALSAITEQSACGTRTEPGALWDGGDAASAQEQIILRTIASFEGEQMQIPPMYSALKRDGKKLYELARAGIEVVREPRPVHFYEIAVLHMELPSVTMRVTCSRGTYIRTLCHDIGEMLGCGACMEQLTRTQVGPFGLEKAYKLREIEALRDAGRLADCVIPVDRLFSDLPGLVADEEADRLLHNGNPVSADMLRTDVGPAETALCACADQGGVQQFRIYDSAGSFIGVFRQDGKLLRPVTMFYFDQHA